MRLHALESMDEQTPASKVKGLLVGLDSSLHGTAGPEGMVHGTPRVFVISSIVCGPVLTDHKTRRCPREGQIHCGVFVDSRFDRVSISFFVERNSQVISSKGKHALVEHEVRQRIGAPIVGSIALEIVDLGVELSSGVDAPIRRKSPCVSKQAPSQNEISSRQLLHNVAVDDLDHDQSTVVGRDIKCLSLHVGVLVGLPPQVLLGHFSETNSLCLLRNRLDGIWAIFWFLGTGDTGQTEYGISKMNLYLDLGHLKRGK